jgi:hypothetical protein
MAFFLADNAPSVTSKDWDPSDVDAGNILPLGARKPLISGHHMSILPRPLSICSANFLPAYLSSSIKIQKSPTRSGNFCEMIGFYKINPAFCRSS